VGADIDPGQAHDGNGTQGEGAAGRAETRKGGSAQGDGDTGVPGEVSEPGGCAAAAAGGSRMAGLGRRTIRLTSLDSAQALVPARSRPASLRSPASYAAPAVAGAAPRAPSCMMTQAGG
jgi:hypothetical protein